MDSSYQSHGCSREEHRRLPISDRSHRINYLLPTSIPRSSLSSEQYAYNLSQGGASPSLSALSSDLAGSGSNFNSGPEHEVSMSQAHSPFDYLVDSSRPQRSIPTPRASDDGFEYDGESQHIQPLSADGLPVAINPYQSPTTSFTSTTPSLIKPSQFREITPVSVHSIEERKFSPPNDSDDEDMSNDEPYARLIFRALMEAPENRLVLKDIYRWFEQHTDKPNQKSGSEKGWQNSIRHNLSMNGAFQKVEQESASEDSKRGYVWVLAEEAKLQGVKSTTRYRKTGPTKKGGRSDNPAPARQRSGRRGGRAARRGRNKGSHHHHHHHSHQVRVQQQPSPHPDYSLHNEIAYFEQQYHTPSHCSNAVLPLDQQQQRVAALQQQTGGSIGIGYAASFIDPGYDFKPYQSPGGGSAMTDPLVFADNAAPPHHHSILLPAEEMFDFSPAQRSNESLAHATTLYQSIGDGSTTIFPTDLCHPLGESDYFNSQTL